MNDPGQNSPNSADDLAQGQAAAIVALLAEPTIRKAAERAGVGERTLQRWLTESEAFRAALRAAENAAIDEAARRLIGLADEAVSTLRAILKSRKASPAVRVRAARAVLDYLLKLRELRSVEERLAAVEQYIAGKDK